MGRFSTSIAAVALVTGAASQQFDILRHVGGNGQWFPGPEVTGISSETPEGCTVELAGFFSRHGSRYPDRGAYNGWVDLQTRLQASGNLTTSDPSLAFLSTWSPVLSDPAQQIAQISPTGYKELHAMGATWRLRYAHLYDYNTPFTMWANWYASSPRVRDSARLFAQGFIGPNATTLGTIYALNASDPASWMNSLGTSDLCPAYRDSEGAPYTTVWNEKYRPPIRERLNALVTGFSFTDDDVSSIPYLCGFETQIAGRRSPFCDILTEEEVLAYEYAQDLRYWYGAGLGYDIGKSTMLPVLAGFVQRLVDGPNATYTTSSNTTFVPPKVIANFANDGQINQLIAATGIFDNEPSLSANFSDPDRKFRASRIVTMRGTVAFERLSCPSAAATPPQNQTYTASNSTSPNTYIRLLLNDVVYPVANCADGPGSSCSLAKYQSIVQGKMDAVGDFKKMCNATNPAFETRPVATFFRDDTVEQGIPIKP
ncbi:phosphoglycerate mutase-like protein [Periconia macrospinosa]|uniref:Phosphoglycerate mutase-like protein n=1 Tax=Periconia macrospinosa TaxID=97972 RepID=A0A2V1DEU2_9PLEO|nr:phosphoglycerate mutase-like protein [Periconia macrospinosa]